MNWTSGSLPIPQLLVIPSRSQPRSRGESERGICSLAGSRRAFRLPIALLICVLSVASATAQSPDAVQTAVRSVIEHQQDAWNHHDLEGFMAGYWNSPELTFNSGTTQTAGWQPTLDRYRKSYQSGGHEMGKLEFSDLNIQPLGNDAAFVRGAWKLTMSDGKTPHGLFTLIFRKFPDGWKIVHDHTSGE